MNIDLIGFIELTASAAIVIAALSIAVPMGRHGFAQLLGLVLGSCS